MAAIQIIQMLALLPPLVCPTGQRRVFSIPREWCQRGPLKTAALRSEMNAPAEHNGPNLNTMRIYARSEPQQKTEDSSAPIQPSSYFISCKFATFIHTFCGFLSVYRVWNAWTTLPGVTPVWMWVFFFYRFVTETSCLRLAADLHGLGQPLPCQVRTQAPDQGPPNRRHGRSAAGWNHPGRW